jgi:hypothetical protein
MVWFAGSPFASREAQLRTTPVSPCARTPTATRLRDWRPSCRSTPRRDRGGHSRNTVVRNSPSRVLAQAGGKRLVPQAYRPLGDQAQNWFRSASGVPKLHDCRNSDHPFPTGCPQKRRPAGCAAAASAQNTVSSWGASVIKTTRHKAASIASAAMQRYACRTSCW